MRDLNKVMLIGNLTRDPEIRSIPSGQSVASFAVATNRRWNDASGELQTAVEYTDIVAWGKLAEIAGQILKKGRRAYIEGRLQTRNWEGQDGVRRYKTEVIASDLIVLDKLNAPGFEGGSAPATEAAPTTNQEVSSTPIPESATAKIPESKPNNNEEIDIEDIPF